MGHQPLGGRIDHLEGPSSPRISIPSFWPLGKIGDSLQSIGVFPKGAGGAIAPPGRFMAAFSR